MGGLLPLKEISSLPLEEILISLKRLQEKVHSIPSDQYFNKLIGADVCFCFFRFLCVTGQPITRAIRDQVTDIARIAVQTVKTLITVGQPWWNMLHTLFQYSCVLIAMDSLEGLEELKDILAAIDLVKNRFPPAESKSVNEAITTLHVLIQALQRRKQKEMETLSTALSSVGTAPDYSKQYATVPPVGMTSDYPAMDTSYSTSLPEMNAAPMFANSWTFDDLDWISTLAPLGQGN
jgi:hypothetical protein